MIKYKVIHVTGSSVTEASEMLEEELKDLLLVLGWKPQGGVSVTVDSREDSIFGPRYTLAQAMIKEE